jgi:hypothetical protein
MPAESPPTPQGSLIAALKNPRNTEFCDAIPEPGAKAGTVRFRDAKWNGTIK